MSAHASYVQAAERGHLTKSGKGDYVGERMLRKIFTPEQLAGMNGLQFDAAKKAEQQRLDILHTTQVRIHAAKLASDNKSLISTAPSLLRGAIL